MTLLLQLSAGGAMVIGLGWWVWRASGRPAPTRHLTWLWCGLVGLSLGLLALQALVYLDLPLRRTIPFLALLAAAGCGALIRDGWRARGKWSPGRWREVALVLGAGLGAGAIHSTSALGIGSDRFIGHAQVDHVNYVLVAQFLAEEPFSTELADVGLRPWLWRSFELKHHRITQCVALGATAVLTGSDAQRAWAAVSVGFTMLLAMALAGMWRVAAAVPVRPAALLGFAGACLPVVTQVYLLGYFSQLGTLFVFPALLALARAGALPPKTALVWLSCLLGYLAGAYTEFWPLGLAVAGGLLLRGPGSWARRVGVIALIGAGSVVLTGAYAWEIPRIILPRLVGVVQSAETLAGFAPDGITWRGWGRNFFAGDPPWVEWAGVAVAVAGGFGMALQSRHRRWDWLLAGSGPAALAAWWLMKSEIPVYPTYKLFATFSPVMFGLAVLGCVGLGSRLGRWPRVGALAAMMVVGGMAVFGGLTIHRALVRETHTVQRDRLERLWAVRDRVEQDRGAYLIENGNGLIGAWLAFFARDSQVYYDLPALSDRRVPSESAVFRWIPAGAQLDWLDLDLRGPVPPREASPRVALAGVRSTFSIAGREVFLLGSATDVVLTRSVVGAPAMREAVLEFGLTPMPQVGACRVVLADGSRILSEFVLDRPRPVSVKLNLPPGDTRLRLAIEPADGAGREGDLAMLQALSLERTAIGSE